MIVLMEAPVTITSKVEKAMMSLSVIKVLITY